MKFFALLLAGLGSAQAQVEYWPLTPGNQWVYRASLGDPVTVEVAGTETIHGLTYSVVRGWPGIGNQLLRQDGERLVTYDRQERREVVFVDFAAPLGRDFPAHAPPCNTSAAITNRDFSAALPLGNFTGMVAVRYGGNRCADAGLEQDLFLPYAGLMRRTEQSFTGPRNYDLVYARINGVVMVAVPETGFAVSVAPAGDAWTVRMTLRTEAARLEFASSQSFDIAVKSEKGEDVYRWSADKAFLAVMRSIEVRGEKNWAANVPVPSGAGRYTVEAWLTAIDGLAYRASVPMRVN